MPSASKSALLSVNRQHARGMERARATGLPFRYLETWAEHLHRYKSNWAAKGGIFSELHVFHSDWELNNLLDRDSQDGRLKFRKGQQKAPTVCDLESSPFPWNRARKTAFLVSWWLSTTQWTWETQILSLPEGMHIYISHKNSTDSAMWYHSLDSPNFSR